MFKRCVRSGSQIYVSQDFLWLKAVGRKRRLQETVFNNSLFYSSCVRNELGEKRYTHTKTKSSKGKVLEKNERMLIEAETSTNLAVATLRRFGQSGLNETKGCRVISAIELMEKCCKAKLPPPPEIASSLLDKLSSFALFLTAERLLEVLHSARVARHIDYLRLANAASSEADVSRATKACELAHEAGFAIDYATCQFLIKGLCLRSLISFEVSSLLNGLETEHEHPLYRAQDFEDRSNLDIGSAIRQLDRMSLQGGILPDEGLFLHVLLALVLTHKYDAAIEMLLYMRRENPDENRESNLVSNDNHKPSQEQLDKLVGSEIAMRMRKSGAGVKAGPDFYTRILPPLGSENRYSYDYKEEMYLQKEWHGTNMKGWGPFFLLREIGTFNEKKRKDTIMGPLLPLVADASDRERRVKVINKEFLYDQLKSYRQKTKRTPPSLVFRNREAGDDSIESDWMVALMSEEQDLDLEIGIDASDEGSKDGLRRFLDVWRDICEEDLKEWTAEFEE